MTLEDWGWSPFFAKQFRTWQSRGLIPARVIRGEKNYFRVWSENGELTVRFAGKIRHRADGRADLPVVGDWVAIESQPGRRGLIHALLERKSSFARNLPGRRKGKGRERIEQQVIAANVDLILIVCGLDRDYNLRRIERYLTLVSGSGAEALVVLNKADLCADPQYYQHEVEGIAGKSVVQLCMAKDPEQLDFLFDYLQPGKTLALLGSSGVGKSTILNGLLGEQRQKIGAVSDAVGKGRHTTTHRELFLLPLGGILMDNPGMRELHLWGEEEDLSESFTDIEELAIGCKFSDCAHKSEPGCAVRVSVENGNLSSSRLENYHKLKDELTNLHRRR
ncbi:ribosome small subunit-dependent GTPase A [Malonomonas rubra]|uniref:ribosome small subunit-dependent GTPase A n=1 Tax=Malonomonas rubra TaxID=57040 RepID=UPI0026EB066F|nr:ribosome small subunit-dependent GTPase A [Malonomonas rubra]